MAEQHLDILIIDDQADQHELYAAYLEDDHQHAFRFFNAYTGAEGEAMYKDHPVDCVLLDYHLPDKDGLEVLKTLIELKKDIPIVMLTGEGNEMVAVNAMKLGSQDYLPKQVITPAALRRTAIRAAERADIMRQMEAYRRELERSNQDLERFANVVAHDLKAPLRAVTQHLTLVKNHNREKLDEESRKSIDFAVEGAVRMRKLIEAVVEYSRVGFRERRRSKVDCNLVLESVKHNLAAAITETGAEVTNDPLPTVMGDGTQILQLLQNLVDNALKFCKGAPHVHVGVRAEGGYWAFSVRDNGIGIAPEYFEKIFTIFRRLHTEQEYTGTGIGLAVCERVVHNHGGRIWVESQPQQGTTFFFTLPASMDEAPSPARKDA
ncbi:MAG: response regulator [Alphaproteobacteria bacterium]|nr:response regulator [Alphaproteobacteria bacterium]